MMLEEKGEGKKQEIRGEKPKPVNFKGNRSKGKVSEKNNDKNKVFS